MREKKTDRIFNIHQKVKPIKKLYSYHPRQLNWLWHHSKLNQFSVVIVFQSNLNIYSKQQLNQFCSDEFCLNIKVNQKANSYYSQYVWHMIHICKTSKVNHLGPPRKNVVYHERIFFWILFCTWSLILSSWKTFMIHLLLEIFYC